MIDRDPPPSSRNGMSGVIKTVGYGTLWSAAASEARRPLWLVFCIGPPLEPQRRRASLAAALHMTVLGADRVMATRIPSILLILSTTAYA